VNGQGLEAADAEAVDGFMEALKIKLVKYRSRQLRLLD